MTRKYWWMVGAGVALILSAVLVSCSPAPRTSVDGHPSEMAAGQLGVSKLGEFDGIRIYRVCDGDTSCFYVADGRSVTTTTQFIPKQATRYVPVLK